MNLSTQKILVTGGAGFLGQHVVHELLRRGVSRKNIFIPRSTEFDLRRKENCEKVVKNQDVVIHLASMTGGVEFHREHPAEIFYNNLIMGVELMETARLAGVKKFVSIGSAAEYPENIPAPFKEENIWSGPPAPSHFPYAIAKRMLSVQAQAYRAQYNFNAIHLILTNMYGPGEKKNSDFLIPTLIRRIKSAKNKGEKVFEVWGSGRPTRDFLYVADAAAGIILAAEKYDQPESVNIASGWEISIKEIVSLLTKIADFDGDIYWNTAKPDGQMRRVLDTSRAEQKFGFKAKTDFESGLKSSFKYYYEN